MKILSLFDGMACGALAMQAAGIEIDKYIAYLSTSYAIQTAQHNFPFIEERGDVFKADFTEYAGFDYLIGGSPCTYWSIAQTKNRETVASGMGWELFSQYVRALHEAKPRFFLYENNKSMSAAIRASITETFGFEPISINSALVSAQNRQRLYWCGIRQADGTYIKADIQQPKDRGILLKDILETNGNGAGVRDDGKAHVLTASYDGAVIWNSLERHQRTMVADPVCVAQRGRYDESGKVYQHFEAQPTGKTNTLTTVSKDNMIMEPLNADGLKYCNDKNIAHICRSFGSKAKVITENEKAPTLMAAMGTGGGNGVYYAENMKIREATKAAQIYEVKDGFITVKGNKYPIKLVDGFYIIRKLTVRECMRLQTVPEWYEWPVSKSQAYKMLGNGWTVEVIAHLLRGLK